MHTNARLIYNVCSIITENGNLYTDTYYLLFTITKRLNRTRFMLLILYSSTLLASGIKRSFDSHYLQFLPVCFPSAHDDAIWTAAWGKSEADGSETIVTGSLDDMVKVWKW